MPEAKGSGSTLNGDLRFNWIGKQAIVCLAMLSRQFISPLFSLYVSYMCVGNMPLAMPLSTFC